MSAARIRGGTVLDRTGERRADVVVDDGRILAVLDPSEADDGPDDVLDAEGCIVTTGLVDLHAHVREPGAEEVETVASLAEAAVLGGFTTVLVQPTGPTPVDSVGALRELRDLARGAACRIEIAGTITQGRDGSHLAPLAELAAHGVRWFADAGVGVQDPLVLRRALEYAAPLGVTIGQHCIDERLADGGVIHEGEWSSRLGVPGSPAEAEEIMVLRDIALARLTGGRLHFQRVSTASSVAMIGAARAGGLSVSADVTAHHVAHTVARAADFDPRWRVEPPLRTEADVAACRQAVADGAVSAVVTDHCPRSPEDVDRPFDEVEPGTIGLETALGVVWSTEAFDAATICDRLSWSPAAMLGRPDAGRIAPGVAADLAVIDPAASWTVDASASASRARNSLHDGHRLHGRVRHTLVGGRVAVRDHRLEDR